MTDINNEPQEPTQPTEPQTPAEPTPSAAPSQAEKRTEREKAEYNLRKRAEEARAQGVDPAEVLGIKPQVRIDNELPDDAPLTVGTFREMQKQDARKTAEEMAASIEDEEERTRVQNELRYIVPSGDAQADFRRALAAANVEHNAKIAEMLANRGKPTAGAAGGSRPAPETKSEELTPEEMVFTRHPYNMSKEKILAARPK